MRSIFVKTYLKIALLTLVCLAAFVVYLDSALHDSDVEDFTAIGNLEAELLIHKLRAEPQVHWPDIIKNYKPSLPIATIEITQGILEGWKMMDEELGLFFHQDDDAWGIARSIDDTGQYIYLQEDITPTTFLDLLDSFGPAFLLFFMLGLSMFYLSHRIEVMVTELASGVSAFTDGQLSTRLKQDYEEPFETLSRNFNNMAERLERILNDQQVMIGALPHELRTPIARMRFALDTTRSANTLAEARDIIERIDGYLYELETLVEDVLKLSRLQLSEKTDLSPTDIAGLVNTVIQGQIKDADIDIVSHLSEPLGEPVYADARLLKLAVSNLISNAQRYAKRQIRVKIYRKDRQNLIVAVHDDGPGIPRQESGKLFVPFARIDQSRSRATGGVGLGLCLVDLIMRKHGGSAYYGASELGGAGFFMEWPAFSLPSHFYNDASKR